MESMLAACSATCRTGGGLAATSPLDLARVLDLEEQQQEEGDEEEEEEVMESMGTRRPSRK